MIRRFKVLKKQLEVLQGSEVGRFAGGLARRYAASRPPLLAAALAYYAAFSLGPLLILLAGGLGIFLENRPDLAAEAREAMTVLIAQALPLVENSADLAQQGFDVLLRIFREGALLTAVFSVVVLLWAGSNFFAFLQLALEVIFESEHPRSFWRNRLISILLVLAVGLAIGFEVVSSVIFSAVEQALERLRTSLITMDIQTWLWLQNVDLRPTIFSGFLVALVAIVVYTLSFRYMPKRGSTWQGALLGALFAVSATLLARQLMLEFIDRERFNIIYGLITTLMLLLLWFYFSLFLYLLGAILAAEIGLRSERKTRAKKTEIQPLLEHDDPETASETTKKQPG